MCNNSKNGAKLPISRKSCGSKTAQGPPHWRHGQCAQHAGDTAASQQRWWILGIKRLRTHRKLRDRVLS